MTLLILGILLWIAAHLFKRIAPQARARLGNRGRALMALAIALAVALMVLGYRGAEFLPVYTPLPGMGHANNLLMLIAIFFFGIGGTRGLLYPHLRHPMLWGMVLWAIAHLLVNGDLASVLLFGGLGLWAVLQMQMINRSPWAGPAKPGRGLKGDAMNLVGTLALYGLVAMIHILAGHNPFLGTYG